MATLVIKSRSVSPAATSNGKNTSCCPSNVKTPSAPSAARSRAWFDTLRGEPSSCRWTFRLGPPSKSVSFTGADATTRRSSTAACDHRHILVEKPCGFTKDARRVTTDIGTVDATVGRLTAPGQPLEVGEREFAGATHKVFVHAAATAVDVIQSLREHGDAELLVFNDRRWTYEQFFADVDALSATLQLDFGVTPGDRLAIAMRNCADWLITFAAAIQVGAVVVPVNSWGSGEELAFTLLNSEATILAADLPRTQAALNTLAAARIPVLFSDVDGDATALPRPASSQSQIRPIPDAVASGRSRPHTLARRAPEDTAMLLYTSGSTGPPT